MTQISKPISLKLNVLQGRALKDDERFRRRPRHGER